MEAVVTLNDLEREFEIIFPGHFIDVVSNANDRKIIAVVRSYSDPIQFSYELLMKVAKIFNNTDFEIQNLFERGREWSSQSVDGDIFKLVFIGEVKR